MIAIITEKPSVGHEIARVVGAHEKCNGYMQGHGYIVTWALGHLVQLALPESYGRKRSGGDGHGELLPFIPDPFRYTIRQTFSKAGKNLTDVAASRGLHIIRRVLAQCDSVVAATDAGREGELIFREIYNHLGCTLPVKRLWISSLTEEAIEKGFRNLKDGAEYDNLYMAADCRAKADWLVGMNASRALSRVSGRPDSSLGRVQTPTLAMIASRYLEHRGFLPSPYWSLSVTLGKGDALRKLPSSQDAFPAVDGDGRRSVGESCILDARKFRYVEDIRDKATAEAISDRLKSSPEAIVGKVERKTVHEAPPLLYDLTELQKECNVHHDMTAEQTLNAAQSLYEKKLISYPRTGSRYISPDIMPGIPSLLRMILRMERFSHLAGIIDPLRTSRRSVDGAKVTDHHALLITGDYVREMLTANEHIVYDLICGRMLEAFGPRCEKETLLIEASVGELPFRSRSTETVSAGWRAVRNRPEEPGNEDDDIGAAGVEFFEGETLAVMGHSLAKCKTRPKPLYTEATLLDAMERCGKQVSDEKAREVMMQSGLGTPATRAGIIETLLEREYIERYLPREMPPPPHAATVGAQSMNYSGRSLIPTERGIALYKAVKDLRIADVELTGSRERSLARIEKGEMKPETFMKATVIYTRQVTKEVLSLDLKLPSGGVIPCPRCGNGRMMIRHRIAKCDSDKCGLVVYRRFLNKELTENHVRQLLESGRTRLIRGFAGKAGKKFDACLTFDKNFNLTFNFPENTGVKAAPGGRRTVGDKTKPGIVTLHHLTEG